MDKQTLPVPEHFDESKVAEVWRVPYQQRANKARKWARQHRIRNASEDKHRIALLLIDCQNTFCTLDFELYIGGQSGRAAVEDNVRLCQFIYRNLASITKVFASLDTHQAMQIFHPLFLVDSKGEHPQPFTPVSIEDVENDKWRVNPGLAGKFGSLSEENLQQHLIHYCRELSHGGRYMLMIWPYHAMQGGIGHALVSSVEEALFFHTVARQSQIEYVVKGQHPMTENYSIFAPEINTDAHGKKIGDDNSDLIDNLLGYDAIIVGGQAKSHCVAWTLEDLLSEINKRDRNLAGKIYLLEDCTSPVSSPDGPDFTEQADKAFERFAKAGMHIVKSSDPISNWPGEASLGRES